MKILRLLAVSILVGAAVETKAQFGPEKDMDSKYATELIASGTKAPDFKMQTPDGKKFQFAKWAKGKTVVLDFWASWCPDCRKANPDVVAAYQKYHDQGFDVLGVSFDTNKEAWLAAIEKDGLTWTQVSDLQGWGNAAGELYSIAFIPQNALIKDGIIVARNLEGEELFAAIERSLSL